MGNRTGRAQARLKLLQPGLAIRDAQLKLAQLHALQSRQRHDQAQADVDRAQANAAGVQRLLTARVGNGNTRFSAADLTLLQAAVRVLHARTEQAVVRQQEAEQAMQHQRQQLMQSINAQQALQTRVDQAQQSAQRAQDEKQLAEVEDLWPARNSLRTTR